MIKKKTKKTITLGAISVSLLPICTTISCGTPTKVDFPEPKLWDQFKKNNYDTSKNLKIQNNTKYSLFQIQSRIGHLEFKQTPNWKCNISDTNFDLNKLEEGYSFYLVYKLNKPFFKTYFWQWTSNSKKIYSLKLNIECDDSFG